MESGVIVIRLAYPVPPCPLQAWQLHSLNRPSFSKSAMRTTPLPLFDVLSKWVTIRGYVLLEITADPERLQKGKEFVSSGLADGSFKPLVARTFPLEQIVEAHRFLESNQQIGKVVVTV